MVQQIMESKGMVFDFLGLDVLVIWMRAWQKRHGIFPEKKFAFISYDRLLELFYCYYICPVV